MSWTQVCDAWIDELVESVPGLEPPVIAHRYAPWSLEQLAASGTARHFAVWPMVDAEGSEGFVSTPSARLSQTFEVLVWEGVPDAARLMDDDKADAAWLALQEAIRARFEHAANLVGPTAIGQDGTIEQERYVGGSFPAHSHLRVMELRFAVFRQITFT